LKVIERVIEYASRSDVIRIHPFADIHFGSSDCDEGLLAQRLDEVDADPSAYWLLLGDQLDCIGYKDKRFDVSNLPRWLLLAWHENMKFGLGQLQRDELAARINRRGTLADKLLAVVEGNHEASMRRYQELDGYLSLIERIRGRNATPLALGPSGFLVLRFKRMTGDEQQTVGSTFTVVVYLDHGWGGGDLAGGVNLKLERTMDRFDADVFLMGHHHKVTTHTNPGRVRPTKALTIEQSPPKIGAICGTFVRGRADGHDSYAEWKGLRPSPVSTDIVLEVVPDKRQVNLVQRSLRDPVTL
jgi:hypothetical protein